MRNYVRWIYLFQKSAYSKIAQKENEKQNQGWWRSPCRWSVAMEGIPEVKLSSSRNAFLQLNNKKKLHFAFIWRRCTDESFEHKYWFSFFFSKSSNSVLGSNSITTVLVAYCLLRHLLYFALTIIILWGHLYLSFLYAFVSIFVFVFVLQLDTMEVDTSEACLLAMLGHLASSEAFTNACFASLCSCRHHDRCDLVLRHHGHSQASW